MKSRTRKKIFRGAAAALACVAAAGIFLQTTMSVEAAANSLPGIDIIVNGNSSEKPFRILELVDNSENAEIGYYVSGQEPTVKLYTYTDADGNQIHFSTFEEGLSQLPEEERKEFAMNVKIDEKGNIDTNESTGISKVEMKETTEEASPISYKDYKEKYFLEDSDNAADWTRIELKNADGSSRVDSVEAKGSYVENPAGTGDYTKEEQQYYPIRGNVEADRNGAELFRENIQSFSYVEDEDLRGAYFLQFAEVDNADVNAAFNEDENAQSALEKIQSEYDYTNGHYGYYENVYTDLTEDIANNITAGKYTFPGENPDTSVIGDGSNAVSVQANSVRSADSAARTILGTLSDETTAGTQANPYIYLGETIEEYPYYQYTLVGDLAYVKEKAAESHENGYLDGDIILEDGQYWYLVDDDDNNQFIQMELSIVTGRQQVAYEDIASIPEDFGYNYYYVVNQVWFCSELSNNGSAADPSDYRFFGWYYPTYPSGEDIYLPINDGETPTYYISEAQYTLTPGTGDYDFVPGSGDKTQLVQVNQMYYQGGYENHDWLKKYVFHLEKDEYDGFNIQVDTRYADDVSKPVYANVLKDGEQSSDIDVTSYDLIYVNGNITDETAQAIVNNKIPCIVNSSRVNGTSVPSAFSSYINSTDDDDNYVSKHIYFFEGTATSGEGLVNDNFAKEFNATQKAGFEEITEYIEQENQYRDLGEDGEKLEPLSDVISQARAVEYVINYQYKRNTNLKSEINVLEIMPAKDCGEISEEDIRYWLGIGRIRSTKVCCEQPDGNWGQHHSVQYAFDNDTSTYWHSKWNNTAADENHPEQEHYIEIEFTKAEAINGLEYTPRQDGKSSGNQDFANGILKQWTIKLYDINGNEITENEKQTGKTTCNLNNRDKQTLKLSRTFKSVKKVRLYFDDAYGNKCATCAELSVMFSNNETQSQTEVTVTPMTAAEFVGHIDDIASKYDIIYISGKKNSNSDSLLTGAGELCYSHVGSGLQVKEGEATKNLLKLLGQLDTEYLWNSDGTKVEKQEWKTVDGKRQYVDVNFFAPINTYGPNGGGYFRGSGNDMTAQQSEKLLDFVKSGYPVIVSDKLLSDGNVNTNTVDNSSYYYEFLSSALKYDNVISVKDLNDGKKDIRFFANLAKPTITFAENGTPPEPERLGGTQNAISNVGYVDGELKYVFTVGNDSDAAPADTTYDCQLYLDLNFDGNLSSKEEQEKYITIQDEDGNVVSQVSYGDGDSRYELQAGKQYTLTRKLPKDYFKLITWKLEVSSNRNRYIHTSVIGCAKQKNQGERQKINVLQLVPSRCTWTLTESDIFKQKIKQVYNDGDFDIEVTNVSVSSLKGKTKEQVANDILKDKQMLVIGFADVYEDIPNENNQVDAILEFIRSGKSVLFSHDTTSYVNYSYYQMHNKIATTKYNSSSNSWDGDENTSVYEDNYLLYTVKNTTWGLSLNTVLRSVVGMDRYGITSDAKLSNGNTVSEELKKGQAISDSVTLQELMEKAGDIAWQTNNNKNSSYGQTQAYSNVILNGQDSSQVGQATKVNDGAITQYPYVIGDSISVSTTHGQYYQLALEQDNDINGNSDGETDVVVWYCLTNGAYSNSPNDARNNYYFYSKGNVIYTGAGHSTVNQEQEIELFVNAMVAAANVTAVDPEINFVDNLNPTADIETTRYYATDQSTWTDDNEANVLEDSMDFYVNVKDYNMVSADLNQDDLDSQEMTLEFYINSDKGKSVDGAPDASKMLDITKVIDSLTDYDGTTTKVDPDGKFHLTQNSAYQLTLSNPEQYLKTTGSATSGNENGYQKDCKLYVKVTSTVYLYGEPKVSTKWASIDLKQRQLFEMN